MTQISIILIAITQDLKATTKPKFKCSTTAAAPKPPDQFNYGLNSSISELKDFALKIPWGSLYGAVLNNGEVLKLAWKDADIVLFITTVYNGKDFIIKMYCRPILMLIRVR